MPFHRNERELASRRAAYSALIAGFFTITAVDGGLQAQSGLTAPQLPPNPQMEENVDLIRQGAGFMMADEESVRLMKQYILKRYVQDNCNANCTTPCRNLGGWLWQNPAVACK